MPIFSGLGRALRWLRDRQGKRQYQVAEAAGVTKAMLSAYETGKQKPSLDTMEKILEALGCDLNDLHNALQIVNERPQAIRRTEGRPAAAPPWPGHWREGRPSPSGPGTVDVHGLLGIEGSIPPEEEHALAEMLSGFHRLLRFFLRSGHLGNSANDDSADILS
jgi:transcriptional regulator with XRE-family HTH domain